MKQFLVKFSMDPHFNILIKKKKHGCYWWSDGFGVIDTNYNKIPKEFANFCNGNYKMVYIELD